MKQLKFEKATQNGIVKGIYRFVGKDIFIFKSQVHISKQYAKQIIVNLKNKGAGVDESRFWYKIDIFGNNDLVKLGDVEFNVKEKKDEEIEDILGNFYKNQYEKGGFKVEYE